MGSHPPARKSSPTFLWQGLLILLPLIVLAAAGIWSLRGQRQAIEQKARQDATATAQVMAARVYQEIQQKLQVAHRPVPLDALDEGPFPFLYPLNPIPPEDFEPDQRFQDSLDDPKALDEILTEHPNALSAAGVPLKVLVLYQKFLKATGDGERARATQELEYAVTTSHPSVLSGPILSELGSTSLHFWKKDQQTRELLREIIETLRRSRRSQWFRDSSWKNWRLEVLDDPHQPERQIVQALPGSAFQSIRAELGSEKYFLYAVEYDGRGLRPDLGIKTPEPFASATENDLTVTAYLSEPQKLYAHQRRQVIWFIGIIAASAITALIGLWVTRRAYLKQQAVNQMKSNFVSSVSHELRAPIASIRLMAERLRSGKVDEKAKRSEYFGFIEQESRRLSTLVENVLDFSRIEDGKKTYQFEETDIEQLATDTVQLMAPHASEKNVTIQTDFQPPEIDPSIDSLEIQQAFINLIDNAIKYSPEGKTITVGLSSGSPEKFQLWVQDNGPGIPQEEQQRIFQRFYRIGSELERETQGVGIGLAIVRHTAEAHGGTVIVSSSPGDGSRFTLELPIKQ